MVFQRADLFQRIIANIRAKKRLPTDVTPVPKARHLSNSKPHLLGSAVAPTASGGDGALQAATRQQQAVGTGGGDAARSRSATRQQQAVETGGGDAARLQGVPGRDAAATGSGNGRQGRGFTGVAATGSEEGASFTSRCGGRR
ncbi:hypothetical protein PF011_g31223 [Phytophthora fragariae]|uniref:Uncharacterized protein n=1 Tax=Phytophthora fragariae TaxID=53985 RepID=A0A6A3GLK7_9STRA|nr:hypothetical protein PF011_g31223 [Phytophthora fragariae]